MSRTLAFTVEHELPALEEPSFLEPARGRLARAPISNLRLNDALDFVDLIFRLVLRVFERLADFVSGPVGFFRSGFLARLLDLPRRVFRISPSNGSMSLNKITTAE